MWQTILLATITVALIALCLMISQADLSVPVRHLRGVGRASLASDFHRARRTAITRALRKALRQERTVLITDLSDGPAGRYRLSGGLEGAFRILREDQGAGEYEVELETAEVA